MEVALALLLLVPSIWLRAFTFAVLWRWFIAGPFHVQQIGLALAFGISITVTLLVANVLSPVDPIADKAWKRHIVSIIFSAFCLLAGWLTHLVMAS